MPRPESGTQDFLFRVSEPESFFFCSVQSSAQKWERPDNINVTTKNSTNSFKKKCNLATLKWRGGEPWEEGEGRPDQSVSKVKAKWIPFGEGGGCGRRGRQGVTFGDERQGRGELQLRQPGPARTASKHEIASLGATGPQVGALNWKTGSGGWE